MRMKRPHSRRSKSQSNPLENIARHLIAWYSLYSTTQSGAALFDRCCTPAYFSLAYYAAIVDEMGKEDNGELLLYLLVNLKNQYNLIEDYDDK